MTDLGLCLSGWCDREAVVWVAGPTLGPSPRLTVVGGVRASELSSGELGVLGPRCLECAFAAVEEVASPLPLVRVLGADHARP